MDTKTFLENFGTIAEAPGGIDQLRSTVIELAVRGLLSSPTESDSPISELLTDIEKSGKISSSNRLVAIVEPLWEIPSTWEWVRFKDIANFETGKTPPTKDPTMWADGDGYAWATIADLVAGETLTTTTKRVSEKAVADSMKRDPSPVGTMLMSFKLTIGKVARLGIPAYFNEAIIAIEVVDRDTDEYLFRTLPLLSQSATSKGAIKGSTLNASSLANMMIPLPPLAEQKRIVAKVDELMALCDELEEKQQRKGTVTTKLRGSAFNALRQAETPDELAAAWERISTNWSHLTNHPDSIPELRKTILDLAYSEKLMLNYPDGTSGEWDATTLGEVAEIRTGKLDANASSPNGQYPFFTCARLPLRIESYTYDFECALIGGNGNFDVHYANGKFDAYQRTYIIKPKAAEETSAKFLYWFMQGYSEELRKQSIGGVIQYLKIGFLKDAPLRLPSLRVQELVVAKIEFMLAMCDQLEKQIQYQQDLGSRLAIASTRLAG